MVWHSSESSILNREISFLAILEIIFAISLYWGISVYYDFYLHIIMSVFLTPFLLLKSKESVTYTLDKFSDFYNKNTTISILKIEKKIEIIIVSFFMFIFLTIFDSIHTSIFFMIPIMLLGAIFSEILILLLISFFYKIIGTLKFLSKGISNISFNWSTYCFVIDLFKIPEIIPELENDNRISNDVKLSHFFTNMNIEISSINLYIRIIIFLVLFIFSIFYRFSIKSTFWFYIPLLFLVKTPSIIEDNSQKVGEFLSSLYETYLAKWRFILALVTLLGFIYSYFNYVDFMNLNIPFTQFLILFYIDISSFEIWRIFQLSIVLSTIFIFLGSNAIRVPKISNNLELKKDLKILIIFYLNIFRNWVSFFYFSSAFLYLFFYFDGINTMYLPMGIKSFLLTIYNFIMYKPFN